MYEQPQVRMYQHPKTWQWHRVETHTAHYATAPVFEPPVPPPVFLPPNPFAPPAESPKDEKEEIQPEADALPPEGEPETSTGK